MSDHESNRLQNLYASLDDAELSRLYEQRHDLTDIARDALTAEIRSRGLKPSVAEPEMMGDAVERDGSLIGLAQFADALEASETLAVLERHELRASLRPLREVERTDGSQAGIWQLLVDAADKDQAIKLLRKHKGMFPLPEVQTDARYLPDESDLFVVAEFDNPEDAALAEHGLVGAKIRFRKLEDQVDGQAMWIVEVAQDDVESAGEAMESAFRSSEESATEA